MTTQPPTIEERLSRLETLFSNVGETVLAQNNAIAALGASVQQTNQNVSVQSATIDVLVANIQQLTENVAAVNQRVDSLTEQTTRNINNLAEQAAQDRQQAAIDRQEFRHEIQRRWEYLLQQGGNGRQA